MCKRKLTIYRVDRYCKYPLILSLAYYIDR